MNWQLINSDVREWAKTYDGPPFHALLTDCPYEQSFMGRKWDSSGIAFDSQMWSALAEHLLPGAFLFAMAGTLNDDLISVAMRQAGLRKYHRMMGWAYGSGFPKATRIDTAIDKAAGVEPRTEGARRVGVSNYGSGHFVPENEKWKPVTQPATELAKQWAGHRYGGQMLKPAIESILIFQKPYDGRPIDSITATGAGALNVDAGRIPARSAADRRECEEKNRHADFDSGARDNRIYGGDNRSRASQGNYSLDNGRWPANFILLDEEAARMLDQQSGVSNSSDAIRHNQAGVLKHPDNQRPYHNTFVKDTNGYQDSGGASRFFFTVQEQIDEADPVFYCAKPDRCERDAGLDHLEKQTRNRVNPGGIENDPKWAPVEARNIHPTVKPIKLCRYLASLLLPPAEYEPGLLVPFSGSGSEIIGALLAGWHQVVGIEAEAEYIPLAEARIQHWRTKSEGELFLQAQEEAERKNAQGNLFGTEAA